MKNANHHRWKKPSGILVALLALGGCKSLPDVCDSYDGKTCIALEVDLSSQVPAAIDALRIEPRSGFTLTQGNAQLSLPNGSAPPFLLSILPATLSATSGVVEVQGLLNGSIVGDATLVTALPAGSHVRATAELEPPGGTTSSDMATPTAPDLLACARIANDASTIHSLAVAGSVPASTGGTVSDGLYHAVGVSVYGTSATAGTDLGTFRGTLRIAGGQFDTIYESMPYQGTTTSFAGFGTFTTNGSQLNLNFACRNTAGGNVSGYSVTGSGTFDITTAEQGFTTVTSYSL